MKVPVAGALLLALILQHTPAAVARDLLVGPGRAFSVPSQAARAAQAGDRVLIAPGRYEDCAILGADTLTIEGQGPASGVVLTGAVCQDKALLIASGRAISVRNLTLEGARSSADNGAGIRVEGASLLVDHVRFIGNQNGIMGGLSPAATVIVRNSLFFRNGTCLQACAHGIYIGHIASLQVERSTFLETLQGHQIKSRAARTEITDCIIEDGEQGTASYEIDIPNGSALQVRNTLLQKGPLASNHRSAIEVGAEGDLQPTPEIVIDHTTFLHGAVPAAVLLENHTRTVPTVRPEP